MSEEPPSVRAPILLTSAALLDLLATLSMASEDNPRWLLFGALMLGLIALAIWSWVGYLKAYTDYKIKGLKRERTQIGETRDAT